MHGAFRASKSPHKLTSVYGITAAAILSTAVWLIDWGMPRGTGAAHGIITLWKMGHMKRETGRGQKTFGAKVLSAFLPAHKDTWCDGVRQVLNFLNFGKRSKKLTNVNTLYERKLCSRSRTSAQFPVSVYRVYSVSNDNICMRINSVRYIYISETVCYWLFVCVIRGKLC
jgi:hypothetical protein